ncbi:DUF2199 domain-containing protein [Kitasatospora sp. NBC_00070]|uniref:DUF2199 domain-containing protein n=1 Tax=Kitasatospora sp. NBC_00070 TaxID=2975962 RepID=UPI003253EB90
MTATELLIAVVIGTAIGIPLGLYLKRRLQGVGSGPEANRAYADGLRRELLERTAYPGEWIDLGAYLVEQPYARSSLRRLAVFSLLHRDGTLDELPVPDSAVKGGVSARLSERAWLDHHEARAAGRHSGDDTGDPGAPAQPAVPTCSCCDEPLDTSEPAFNLVLPDPLAELTEEERERTITFHSEQTVLTRTIGGFVRALLAVPLTDGRTVSLGVWVSLEADTYTQFADAVHGTDDTAVGPFEGRLANALDPWGEGILAAPVSISSPRRPEGLRTPRILDSPVPVVADILRKPWPPAEILTGDRAWALAYDPENPPKPHAHH